METKRFEATDEEVEAMKTWLREQPHLPDKMNEILIRRFLHSCQYDLKATEKKLDAFYTLRNDTPEVYGDRNPSSADVQTTLDILYMCPLPKFTPEHHKLFSYKLKNTNPDLIAFNACVKTFMMLSDVRMITEMNMSAGEVVIIDMDGFSFRYITKIVYSTLKKHMKYTKEAHPVQLKQIHVINCPSYVNRLFNIIKPFIYAEMINIIHFYGSKYDDLFKHVPRDLLPDEYGGKAGTMEEIRLFWKEKLIKHSDYFMDESWWKVNESARPN